MTNPYGDVELGTQGMRALAHPVRLAILIQLQNHGPKTATALAPAVGASPSVTSWHLRHLAKHGLVRDSDVGTSGRERWWEAASRGFRFTAEDEAGREAQRLLSAVLEEVEGDLPGQWTADVEPRLEPQWRSAAGRSNTRVLVTLEELAELESAIEALLAPYVLRKDAGTDTIPAQARGVRLLRYVLPELPEPTGDASS
ncbi:MAG TPA: helix-turn-helix domain-containing protein [Candidatus Lustribacter sp.]|nr:helix-turn-helix domain-containing protein [Candidatus Lustribacter sp.]